MRQICIITAALVGSVILPIHGPAIAQTEAEPIVVEKRQYTTGETIVVTTICPMESSSAWVGLYKADDESKSYLNYQYVGSGEDCRLEFDGLDDPGSYDVRLFPDSGYNDQARTAFSVVTEATAAAASGEGGATVTAQSQAPADVLTPAAEASEAYATESGIVFGKQAYATGERIRITTDCSLYDPNGWIGIFDPSDSARDYGTYRADWVYFRDQADCRFEFAARTFPGTYEVRIIPPSGDFIEVRQAFDITEGAPIDTGIALGKDAYTTHEPIVVTAPCGAESDWIALFEGGASSYSYGIKGEDWYPMAEGTVEGGTCRFAFAAREAKGKYEVRLFHDTNYDAYATHGFEIATTGVKQAPAPAAEMAANPDKKVWISLPKQSFAVDEPVTVAIKCHSKEYPAPDPWIGVRPASEPVYAHPQRSAAAGFQQDWFYLKNYTQPGADCVYAFAGRAAPGTYEVRVFRTLEDCDCEDNLAATLSFTVHEGEAVAGAPQKQPVTLTAAVSRHKDYDYVRADSNDCIVLEDGADTFQNVCDFPVSIYFTRKLGYDDEPMQFAQSMAAQAAEKLDFENKGTVSWLACHESQGLCVKALACIEEVKVSGLPISGFVTAHCRAFEK